MTHNFSGQGRDGGLNIFDRHPFWPGVPMQFPSFSKTVYEKRGRDTVVQVVKRGDKLELRFGNHIIQSAISDTNPDFLQLEYTRAMATGLLFPEPATRFLHIGLGAGALCRFIHRFFPNGNQLVVELLPEVIDVAFRYFKLPVSPRLAVIQGEGGSFIKNHKGKYDLIFLDAYHANGVADHLKTVEFFQSLRNCLEPGGWLVNNVWGSDPNNLASVSSNLARVYSQLYSLPVGAESNIIFFAGSPTATMPRPHDLVAKAEKFSRLLSLDMVKLVKKMTKFQKKRGPAPGVSTDATPWLG